jgi:DNA-binding Lrp family transcriptional regulator
MDDTDRKLIMLLTQEPRMSYRDLTERLKISRQAVHHRIRALADMGLFRSIRAEVSMHYVNCPIVAIWGRSKVPSTNEILDNLGESEFTACVRVFGGQELFVMGALRTLSDLNGYVEFVKRTAEILEPTVGMMTFGDGINPEYYDGGRRKEEYDELSPLDLRIIASLNGDVRKPTSQIARALGVSTKTVRRRLGAMRLDGSLDYYMPWDLTFGEDMSTVLYVHLRTGADKVAVARRLISKDPVHANYFRAFSNLPSFLLGLVTSNRMNEIRNIITRISEDEGVAAVIPNMLFFERTYVTWDLRDTRQILDARNRPAGLHR